MPKKLVSLFSVALAVSALVINPVFTATAGEIDYSAMERDKVPGKFKWNLALFFKDNAAFAKEKEKTEKRINDFKKFSGKLKTDAQIKKVLDEYFSLSVSIERLSGYAYMVYDSDTRNNGSIGLKKNAEKIGTDFSEASSFLKPELLKLPENRLTALIKNKQFKNYDRYLSGLVREKKHVLSEKEESLLAKTEDLQNAPYNIYDIFSSGELPYKEVVLSDQTKAIINPANYGKYRQSANREDRKAAFAAMFGALAGFKNTLAQTLSSQVEANVFRARTKNFNTALEEALFGPELPVNYYKNLIAKVNKELPVLHRYLKLKKSILGVDELRYYDLYASVAPSFTADYSYGEGERLVLEAVKPLGDEYVKEAERTIAPGNGWIDIYPNLGKATGAYMSGSAAYPHPYILMNYTNDYDSVSTLVHELGHSVHTSFTAKNQSYPKAGYSTLTAETASTFNENLLLDYLLKNETNKEKRIALLGDSLELMRTTLFRQALFAEFELAIYSAVEKGTPLTADYLNAEYLKLLKKYYGDAEGVVKIDDAYAIEWAYVPHFYYDYYVYNYVGGYLTGLELSEKALADTKSRDKYLNLLKSGDSKPTEALLKEAGADILEKDAYKEAFLAIDERVAELEKLTVK